MQELCFFTARIREAQYASRVYVDRKRSVGVTQDMSKKGNPYANARMGSFYKTLRSEEVDLQEYLDLDDNQPQVNRFIGELHNWERLHSSLEYVAPVEFGARYYSV